MSLAAGGTLAALKFRAVNSSSELKTSLYHLKRGGDIACLCNKFCVKEFIGKI
jgi:hypothetical protein